MPNKGYLLRRMEEEENYSSSSLEKKTKKIMLNILWSIGMQNLYELCPLNKYKIILKFILSVMVFLENETI